MEEYIMGFWRKTKGRCDRCHRPTNNMYEVREGPVIGHFCGKFCYDRAVEAKEAEKGTVEEKVEELKKKKEEETDISYW